MTKDYIRDDGKVRLCTSNIAKMNIFESMYYHRYRMWENIVEFIDDLKESVYLIRELFIIIILPIMYPIMAWWEIKKARKEVKRHEASTNRERL